MQYGHHEANPTKTTVMLATKPCLKRVSRLLSKIGKRAGVIVNKADGKYASAHDLPQETPVIPVR